MRQYRCYFVDESAAVSGWRLIEHEAVEAAQQHALGVLVGYSPAVGVELWDGSSLVFRYNRLETPQTASELRNLCAAAVDAAEREIDVTLKHATAWGAANLAAQAEALDRGALRAGQ